MAEIHKSNASKAAYETTQFPASAINLTNTVHSGGYVIGRAYPAHYLYTMPHDKISDRHDFNLLAEQLVTPIVSRLNASIHNFYVPFRAVDNGFKKLMNPTKQNGMSFSLSVPSFSLRQLVKLICTIYKELLPYSESGTQQLSEPMTVDQFNSWCDADSSGFDVDYMRDTYIPLLRSRVNAAAANYDVYNIDIFEDLYSKLLAIGDPVDSSSFDWYYNIWTTIFDFFCGEGSALDYLDYPIVNHESVRTWLLGLVPQASFLSTHKPDPASSNLYQWPNATYGFDDIPRSEYPIRALYAIWFEHFRNKDLEPRKSTLPEYSDFGSTSLLTTMGDSFIYCMLPLRPRCWSDDPFTAAQIDDISRHVYAPIYDSSVDVSPVYQENSLPPNAYSDSNYQLFGNNLQQISIGYVDFEGHPQNLNVPIPASLPFNSDSANYSSYALDLFATKKAEMLQRYLKRKFYFGDEYRDEIRAQYDVTIADYALLRPTYLSGMVKDVDISQQVANTGAPAGSNNSNMVEQGSRLAYGSADSTNVSDGYEYFAEEHGIIISIFGIVPRAQYSHVSPLHSMLKSMDFPRPVFAMQQEELIRTEEMTRNGINNSSLMQKPFGFVPYGHGYRYKLDTVHGQMLSSKYDYTFGRFYEGLTDDGTPKLNYWFIHCRPNLPMFANSVLLDGQFYGSITSNLFVERILPMPVEQI